MATEADAKKRLAEVRKVVEAGHQQYLAATKGRPVPNQEDADLAKLGHHVKHHETGASPEPRFVTRHMEAARAGGAPYATRATTRAPGGSAGVSGSAGTAGS